MEIKAALLVFTASISEPRHAVALPIPGKPNRISSHRSLATMAEGPTMIFGQKMLFAKAALKTITVILVSIVTGPFRGQKGASTLWRHVLYRALRVHRDPSTTVGQIPLASTVDQYEAYMKRKSMDPDVVEFSNGAKVCWFGSWADETVVLWLHGGAYVSAATPGHMTLVGSLIEKAASNKAKLSCCFLQYDLAPGAAYPTQLLQAVTALQYLTQEAQIPLSRIVLVGDSAGGNLALGLMSHLSHPHTSLPIINSQDNFKGLLLISPWVSFDQSAACMVENADKDYLGKARLKLASDKFMAGGEVDYYNTPLGAGADWWRGIRAQDVCILAGEDELFRDDIQSFVARLSVHNGSKTATLIARGEAHDAPVLDANLGIFSGQQKKAMDQWVLAHAV
ncbi:Alpha/Beta hydrolase protein [Truncatella angustata]|uniref:Alpha/Beta hydrolase protein n=1 Tax=Truncatella angustata TaxID=152316 RepID=A0A9P9A1W1_9PEZI|nr:Alpha/Beta hydrolase protein [Truncatella angustata]KAH6657561.1 Alpha/Beta hydrolase protein [Truncatella angustata]